MTRRINHIMQSTDTSCLSASIAMLRGHDNDSIVLDEFGTLYTTGETGIYGLVEYLNRLPEFYIKANFPSINAYPIERGDLCLLTVPSLNKDSGWFHSIVADARFGSLEVYDPAMGRPGCGFYSSNGELPGSTKLASFVIDAKIYLLGSK